MSEVVFITYIIWSIKRYKLRSNNLKSDTSVMYRYKYWEHMLKEMETTLYFLKEINTAFWSYKDFDNLNLS